jgi:hypothetical protein
MTLIHEYNNADLANKVGLRAEKNFSAHAEVGTSDTIGVVINDLAGNLDFVGYKKWEIREDACPAGNRVAWRGYVSDQVIGRTAGDVKYPHAASRTWDLDLVEDNGWLTRQILRGADCKRPSETVTARLAWLLSKPGFTGFISDYGNVEPSTVLCDPVDYNLRTGADVLRDLSLVSGFNFYVRYREASDDLELFFLDFNTSDKDDSGFTISNVPADIDYSTVWSASPGAKLRRGVQRIASGMAVPYPGGYVYDDDPATAAEFGTIDQVAPASNVKTKTAATALDARLLQQHDEQDERVIDVVVTLPAAKLTAIKQGQLMRAKFSHLPGWGDYTYCRALAKTFSRPDNLTQAYYDVGLELSPLAPGHSAPVAATATRARLMGENEGSPNGPTTYQVIFTDTGDAPGAGQPSDPKQGLVDYVVDGSDNIALEVHGAGALTVELKMSFAAVESGSQTAIFQVLKNGVQVLAQSFTTAGGLRFVSHECDFTGAVDVVDGDQISVQLSGPNATSTWTIPAGVGGSDHRLLIFGNLVA